MKLIPSERRRFYQWMVKRGYARSTAKRYSYSLGHHLPAQTLYNYFTGESNALTGT